MPTKTDWRVTLAGNPGRFTARHRNWPVVCWLTVLTVALLLTSIPAELWLSSRAPMMACYVGSALAGTLLLAFLFNKRLWVEQPPTR